MRILAVDPGASLIGYSILDDEKLLVADLLEPHQSEDSTFNQCLNQILWQAIGTFRHLLDEYTVTHVAWEIVPAFGQYAHRDKITAVVNGVKTLTFINGLSWCEQSPIAVKKAATNNAKASKEEMKKRAQELFPHIGEFKGYDVYDSALVGWTAYQKNKWVSEDQIFTLEASA